MSPQPFEQPAYTLITSVFVLRMQMVTRVFAEGGALCAMVEHTGSSLHSELVVFEDEAMLRPLFLIRTRRAASMTRDHDLLDLGGARLGCLRTPGFLHGIQ